MKNAVTTVAFEDELGKPKWVIYGEVVSAALWLCDVNHTCYCLPNADLAIYLKQQIG